MLKTVAFVLVALVLIVFLRESKPEYALFLSAVVGAMLLGHIFLNVISPLKSLFEKFEEYGVESNLIFYVLKVFGICYITKFASELCADFGQTSLAGRVELGGRAAVFVLTLPIINKVLELASALMR